MAGSSGARVRAEFLSVDADSDPEVRELDQALLYRPSGVSIKGKGISLDSGPKGLIRKQKANIPHVRSSVSLPMPKTDLTKHLSGGKSSREEATKARSAPSATSSGGYLPVDETEVMEVEEPTVTSKGEGKVQADVKMLTFSPTVLGSFLGPDCFLDDEEDQVSSLPSSRFGPEKFVPNWDVKNKDSVMGELTARMFLFNINTTLDHSRSRRMRSQDLGAAVLANQAQSNVYIVELYRRRVEAESVKEDLEKEITSLKRKI
ncbi:hypothetical protein Hanom_Chr06g00569831 [Helianthus anomalus]